MQEPAKIGTGVAHIDANAPDSRIDCTAENIEQGLAKLVLSLIELLRQLLERQAIRRSLSEAQVEEMGQALMTLEAKIRELAEHFGLTPADLNLDLGPLGNLLEK